MWASMLTDPRWTWRLDRSACPASNTSAGDRDEPGVASLIARLQPPNPATELLEATGGNGYLW